MEGGRCFRSSLPPPQKKNKPRRPHTEAAPTHKERGRASLSHATHKEREGPLSHTHARRVKQCRPPPPAPLTGGVDWGRAWHAAFEEATECARLDEELAKVRVETDGAAP